MDMGITDIDVDNIFKGIFAWFGGVSPIHNSPTYQN